MNREYKLPQHEIGVSGCLHTSAPLPMNTALVPTEYEAGWAPEQAWML